MKTQSNETPCDDCAIFDQLMYPGLVCRACIASGRYAEQEREGETYETITEKQKKMEKKRTLEATCASEVCAYRGKGVCNFVEGEDFCPMYTNGGNENERAE